MPIVGESPVTAVAVFNDTGTAQQIFTATTGQEIDIAIGTAAAPDTSLNPPVKVVRTTQITAVTGDGGEQMASVLGIDVSTASGQVQTVGVYGGAINQGTAGTPDACGVYGVGNITGSGTGGSLGGFFNGRRETNTARHTGVEIALDNETLTAGTYTSNGPSNSKGVWLHGTGTANVGVGIQFGNPSGVQFAVGIGFGNQVAGGVTGAIVASTGVSIQDDGNAGFSFIVNGTHTLAIGVKTGSGAIAIGHTNATDALTNASALIEAFTTATADPLIAAQAGASVSVTYKVGNTSGSGRYFVAGGANNFLTGTVAGDTGLTAATAAKSVHLGGTTSVIQVTNGNALGHFQTTPITQYNTTGTATGFTAGAGTTVTHLSTFTGNTGTTAYTIGDIVRALKLYGLIAA